MRLDIADVVGRHAGGGQSLRDHVDLAVAAGCGITGPPGAAAVDRGAQDHAVDVVAVPQRVGQPLERHDTDAIADDRAVRPGVQTPALAVGRDE